MWAQAKAGGIDLLRGKAPKEAGENHKAEACFQRPLDGNPNDDIGQPEIGAWYVRAVEAYLEVPRGL